MPGVSVALIVAAVAVSRISAVSGLAIAGFGLAIAGFGLAIAGFGLAIAGFGLAVARFSGSACSSAVATAGLGLRSLARPVIGMRIAGRLRGRRGIGKGQSPAHATQD
jgi:hypothetical protein